MCSKDLNETFERVQSDVEKFISSNESSAFSSLISTIQVNANLFDLIFSLFCFAFF
jgi:hypothetical protein